MPVTFRQSGRTPYSSTMPKRIFLKTALFPVFCSRSCRRISVTHYNHIYSWLTYWIMLSIFPSWLFSRTWDMNSYTWKWFVRDHVCLPFPNKSGKYSILLDFLFSLPKGSQISSNWRCNKGRTSSRSRIAFASISRSSPRISDRARVDAGQGNVSLKFSTQKEVNSEEIEVGARSVGLFFKVLANSTDFWKRIYSKLGQFWVRQNLAVIESKL